MGLKELIEKLEPKIIQYLTIEKEVVEEIHKELFAGTIDRNEWNDYYIKIVEQYGNPIMIAMIKGFRKLQDYIVEALGEENVVEQLKKLTGLETTATQPSYDYLVKKGKLESLNGNLYDPIIINGVHICPVCKGIDGRMTPMIALNPTQHKPDNYYFRCPQCKMDYKIPRK